MFFMHSVGNSAIGGMYGDMAEMSDAGVSREFQIITIAFLGTCCCVMAASYREVIQAIVKDRAVGGLLILPFVSIAWSQDPHRTAVAAAELAVTTVFGVYLARAFSATDLRNIFVLFGWFAVVLSVVLSVLFPSVGIDHREGVEAWQGIFVHKNSAAVCMAFLFSAGLLKPANGGVSKFLNVGFLVLSIGLVAMTQSRTGWILFAICVPFIIFIRLLQRFASRERFFFGLLVTLIVLICSALVLLYLSTILEFLGKDPTLTGRMPLWNAVLHMIGRRPILGYGYHAFWNGLKGESAGVQLAVGWAAPHAQSGFLDVWLDLGGVGLILVSWTFFKGVKDGITCIRAGVDREAEWYLAILLITFVCNLDERTIMYPQFLEWAMYVMACVGLSCKKETALRELETVSHPNSESCTQSNSRLAKSQVFWRSQSAQ
jgi:O-antigen ligase